MPLTRKAPGKQLQDNIRPARTQVWVVCVAISQPSSPLIWGVTLYWDQSVERTMAARWAPAEWPHRYRPLRWKTQWQFASAWKQATGRQAPIPDVRILLDDRHNTLPNLRHHQVHVTWKSRERPQVWCWRLSLRQTETTIEMKTVYLWGQYRNQRQPPLHLYREEAQPWIQTPPC